MTDEVELLRAACCIAGLDGDVCDEENSLLARLAEKIGVGPVSLAAMIERAETDPAFYEEQFQLVQKDPDEAMKILFAVAVADGVLLQTERVILHHFADKLGMPEERFEQLLRSAEKHAASETDA